jgi:membrane protein implicated in regulation of membrane protease activity
MKRTLLTLTLLVVFATSATAKHNPQWLKNAVTLTFTAPLQMIAIAVMMWIPVAAIVLFFLYGMVEPFYFTMVFLLVYFALCTLIATILLKDPLIRLKNEMEAAEEQEDE